jgi:hypothetical protein
LEETYHSETINESVDYKGKSALKWLNKKFGDLTKVVKGNRTFYVDKDRKPLFYYYQDEKNGYVNISYDRMWVFFNSIFGLNTLQTQEIVKIWLEEIYNLRGLTPDFGFKGFELCVGGDL